MRDKEWRKYGRVATRGRGDAAYGSSETRTTGARGWRINMTCSLVRRAMGVWRCYGDGHPIEGGANR